MDNINKMCIDCTQKCKQTVDVVVVYCPLKTTKNAKDENSKRKSNRPGKKRRLM